MKMNYAFIFLLSLAASTMTFAQEWDTNGTDIHNTNSGNVGIGTSNPEGKLHILNNAVPNSHYLVGASILENSESRFQIVSADTDQAAAQLFLTNAPASGNNKHWNIHHTGASRNSRLEIGFGTSSAGGDIWNLNPKMTILTNGYIGIGTVSPTNKLHVRDGNLMIDGGNQYIRSELNSGNDYSRFMFNGPDNYLISYGAGSPEAYKIALKANHSSGSVGLFTNSIERLLVTSNGNVGIGTATPSEKLSVNGTIRSKEIKVEAVPWPDYVFSEDYDLLSLEETEAYIKANKHLPGIPTAEEVAEVGIALGEMNAKLLQKIEELTLHNIDQNKQIAELEAKLWDKDKMGKKVEEMMLYIIELEKKNRQQDEIIQELLENKRYENQN